MAIRATRKPTRSLLGPFWRLNSPRMENGGSIVRSKTPGAPLFVNGHVVDRDGRPVAGAEVDVWHASPVGLYENQDPEQADMNLRGKFTTDQDGGFSFRSVMMVGYPIPTDGVVGRLLEAQSRHPYRPAHLHALVFKPGFKVLISQVYDPADPHIDSDVQFGVTKALIGKFLRHDAPHPGQSAMSRRPGIRSIMSTGSKPARPCCRVRRSNRAQSRFPQLVISYNDWRKC
ncbi:protocatechuate 3,4-dioxygenase beta subunit [Bradyrhizobium sp. LB7.1]